MKYKVTLGNHFKVLEGILFLGLFLIAAVIFLKKYSDVYYLGIEQDVFVFWAINLLPVLYLYIEYYSYNRGSILEIDFWKKEFIYTNRTGITETYNFDDFSKIVVYMAPSWLRGSSFQILPFEQYHYARVHTKSGKEIIITCLLTRKVQDTVESISGVPIEKKKRLFSSILIG